MQSKSWSILALMRLPVVCSCKVREIDDEWRDSVDRGSRRLVLSLPDAGVGDEFLIYQCVDRFDCVSMVEEVHTHRYSACSVQGDVCNLKTNLGTPGNLGFIPRSEQ